VFGDVAEIFTGNYPSKNAFQHAVGIFADVFTVDRDNVVGRRLCRVFVVRRGERRRRSKRTGEERTAESRVGVARAVVRESRAGFGKQTGRGQGGFYGGVDEVARRRAGV